MASFGCSLRTSGPHTNVSSCRLGLLFPASSFLQDPPFYQPQIIGVPWTLSVVLFTLLADLIACLGIYYYL